MLNNDQEAFRKTNKTKLCYFHVVVETPLHAENVGVWTAIRSRRIEPISFNGNINVEIYRQEILQPLFNELHDDELRVVYFHQDGARLYCTCDTL